MIRITICPKRLQCVAVSSVTSPVTQVALTAVKTASSGFVKLRSAEETGSINSTAPARMTNRKPAAIMPVPRRLLPC